MIVPVISIGDSKGIIFPKIVLDKFLVKDRMDMEVAEEGILLTPVKEKPRAGWEESFKLMHKNKDDVMDDIPVSGAFEWILE